MIFKRKLSVVLALLMLLSILNPCVAKAEGSQNYDQSSFEKVFKDEAFRKMVLKYLGQDSNAVDWSKVSDETLSSIKNIDLIGEVEDLQGLEKLTGLERIILEGTKIKGFPQGIETKLTKLESLTLGLNQHSLTIPRFVTLTNFDCGSGQYQLTQKIHYKQ